MNVYQRIYVNSTLLTVAKMGRGGIIIGSLAKVGNILYEILVIHRKGIIYSHYYHGGNYHNIYLRK